MKKRIHSETRLSIYAFIPLVFLVMLISNASACWEKETSYDSGTATTNKSNSSYADADIYNYAGPDSVVVWAMTEVYPYQDPTNDDLYAYAYLGGTWGAICHQNYFWEDDPPAPSHTFEISWNETFSWHIAGDADNYGSGTGTAMSSILYYITYSVYPGINNHYVEFYADSDKTEDGLWINTLELCWEPVDDVELEWNDIAFSQDNTYGDHPASGEHADDKSWSEDAYTSQGYLLTCAAIEGHTQSMGYDNAFCPLTDYEARVTNYDLSY